MLQQLMDRLSMIPELSGKIVQELADFSSDNPFYTYGLTGFLAFLIE